MNKRILLINPWIEDFSAFDQWIKPITLLKILRWLKNSGVDAYFIDCLDRSIWGGKSKKWNSGKYRSEYIEKPEVLSFIPRRFRRFGASPEECYKKIKETPPPDFVFLAVPITYWYLSLHKLIKIVREIFPESKIVVGGNYAILMPEHLKEAGPDMIMATHSYQELQRKIAKLLNIKIVEDLFETIPDLSFYPEINRTSSLLTTQGCPFKCSYCAVPILYSIIKRRSFASIIKELHYLAKRGIEDIAFLDDALLVDRDRYIKPLLRKIILLDLPIRFHLPNAVHLRYIDEEVADLMKKARFRTIRVGLESIDPAFQEATGNKANLKELFTGVSALKKAGFSKDEIGAYVIYGAPGTDFENVKRTIEVIHSLEIKVRLVTYSPVPKTKDFYKYATKHPEILKDPLLHNKVVVMYYNFSEYNHLKKYSDSLNSILRG